MEKIIEQAEGIIQQAKLSLVLLEGKDKLIAELKAENANLKTQLMATTVRPIEVWVKGELFAPGVVKWSLHVSEPLKETLKVNIRHTNTKTGTLDAYAWDIPAGQTSVGSTYGYGTFPSATFQVEAGTGYTLSKAPDRPKAVTIPLPGK